MKVNMMRGKFGKPKPKAATPYRGTRSPVAEAFRLLSTNIQFSSADRTVRTILVTSPGVGEGKSLTVTNLAASLADSGSTVILVDGDLRKPTLHSLLDLPNERGITNFLVGNLGVDAVLQETAINRLRVILCGPIPPNPAELLSSERMSNLVQQLRGKADFVLFDAPPALAVADAVILSTKVDGVILVVQSGKTIREAGKKAYLNLLAVGAPVIGAVLNIAQSKMDEAYY